MNRTVVLVVLVVIVLGGLFFALRPAPPEAEAQERVLDVEVRDDAMVPAEFSVDEGDRVMLGITADRPVELHLHGYDLEEEAAPDEPAEMSFDANLTGRFEIEDHGTGEELGTLTVEPR